MPTSTGNTPTIELTWNCSEREVGGKKKQETITGETSVRELVATTVCRTESVTEGAAGKLSVSPVRKIIDRLGKCLILFEVIGNFIPDFYSLKNYRIFFFFLIPPSTLPVDN